MTRSPQALFAQYNRTAILSATPSQLLTMLYDRLLLDLRRAEAAQQEGSWSIASEQLKHAQEIVVELSSTLNRNTWDGAESLYALYDFVRTELVSANIGRDTTKTANAIALLEPLQSSWHEAASLAHDSEIVGATGVA